MCFSGGGKVQTVKTPVAAPTPTITPSESSAATSPEARRKRLERLRYGMASTIKTGVGGVAAPLSTQATTQPKTKLGE